MGKRVADLLVETLQAAGVRTYAASAHHIQPSRTWSHHVHGAASGKPGCDRGRPRGERSPRHPRRPARSGTRYGPERALACDGDFAPGRQNHREDELTIECGST